jgi:hypothetical protein
MPIMAQSTNSRTKTLIAHNGKVIMVPEALQDRLIDQYHLLLNHPDITKASAGDARM